ncbi:MAG: hypothetical protein ACRCZD_17400 [Phycicoccus sp.]
MAVDWRRYGGRPRVEVADADAAASSVGLCASSGSRAAHHLRDAIAVYREPGRHVDGIAHLDDTLGGRADSRFAGCVGVAG